VSSESTTASPPSSEPCATCGAPLAVDQRYCLECGARRAYLSSMLAAGPHGSDTPVPAAEPGVTPTPPMRTGGATAVIAGVGVLLLAMGVGVLIGRSSGSSSGKETAAVAPVISVAAPSTGAAAGAPPSTAAFSDDWPSGKDGYTVQLQTLPEAGTEVGAVAAAKAAAAAKGATGVGALKSDDYSSLAAGSYIVYAGVYTTKPDAQKALPGLKKNFPGATVVKVSNSAQSSAASPSGSESGVGQTPSKPAPPTVLNNLRKGGGGSYEQKSKNLPNVVSTG
jgi:hypothetical protein